jgi:uncharacterized sulfatase
MNRRDFLKKSGAVVAGSLMADLGMFESSASAAAKTARRPNIVFILVDEMRFPSAFPAGVHTPEEFLRRFMPNVFQLWRHGVKFENYFSAGNACSPARASLATGLYPHQQWLLDTRTSGGPSLQTAFPTYGRLLKAFGYQTPYIGKWHLSNPPPPPSVEGYLADYGFTGLTNPDPIGLNGQGAEEDGNIANQAVQWLQQNGTSATPFCLTVSFVNPHDKQFFWAGSEGNTFENLFTGTGLEPDNDTYATVPSYANPPSAGYGMFPPNWESFVDLRRHGKPATQQVVRSFQEFVWGGAPDARSHTGYSVRQTRCAPPGWGVGIAPIHYWQRGLDMYTLTMTMVDTQIGKVIAALPRQHLANTVFVFASDHGDYAGAHGLLSGKLGTAYEEAIHVPLIVTDPSGRFVKDPNKPRKQLASSVDLAPMLVTLGNRGRDSWKRGRYAKMYDERLDLVQLLRNPNAKGRDHVLFATDEILPTLLNYLNAPTHVLAVRTHEAKLVTYTHWAHNTTTPIRAGMQLEFYDYATSAGRAETRSNPNDPRVKLLLNKLFNQYVPTQMEAPLPAALRPAAARARAEHILFEKAINAHTIDKLLGGKGALRTELGYGLVF